MGELVAIRWASGYTGEDGFELFLANDGAAALWASVAEAEAEFGIVPCGLRVP